MKKFECTVTREDKYIIEFDENIINEEWMEDFKKYFYDFETLEEHAKYLAQFRARFGHNFIEGYGVVNVNGKDPRWNKNTQRCISEEAINIKVISEDRDCYVDVNEIN